MRGELDVHRWRILLIDDDEDEFILTRDLLAEIKYHKFDLAWVATYSAAVEEIAHDSHDIYLLDYHLGEHNGLELLREVIRNRCKKPLILLTGQGCEAVAVEAMKCGAMDYLVKETLESDSLYRAIGNAMEKFALQRMVEEQQTALVDAERQRVMLASLTATCHHLGQPLTVLHGNLQMLLQGVENLSPDEMCELLNRCWEAVGVMIDLVQKFRKIRQYRTKPYLPDVQMLDIEVGSVHSSDTMGHLKSRM